DLFSVLERNGIVPSGQRGIHILSKLAQEGVLCFGPREGKQPTFVLLDEWIPDSRQFDNDDAIVEIARRYFTSHGPATLTDFVGWTGLKITEGRKGLEAISGELIKQTIKDVEYWMPEATTQPASRSGSVVHLLPGFDEFLLGYKDRSAVVPEEHSDKIVPGGNGMFMPTLVCRGQVAGLWKRTLKAKTAQISIMPFGKLTPAETKASEKAMAGYRRFLRFEDVRN
ncbi:MAG: winged helix DNA-binding domain-containing protein, partial [Roseimicrobium sp.]